MEEEVKQVDHHEIQAMSDHDLIVFEMKVSDVARRLIWGSADEFDAHHPPIAERTYWARAEIESRGLTRQPTPKETI